MNAAKKASAKKKPTTQSATMSALLYTMTLGAAGEMTAMNAKAADYVAADVIYECLTDSIDFEDENFNARHVAMAAVKLATSMLRGYIDDALAGYIDGVPRS